MMANAHVDGGFGVAIVGHASFASGLAAVASHVDPEWASRMVAFDMPRDMDRDDAARAIAALVGSRPRRQVIVLTDLLGAGPCHAARQAIRLLGAEASIELVAGANAPMLLSLLARGPGTDPAEAVRYARTRGRRGIVIVGPDRA